MLIDDFSIARESLRQFAGLLTIVNPIGAIPLFLVATRDYTPKQRRAVARTAALTVMVTLLVAGTFGEPILRFFGISLPSFRVGGGILILLMGISMLQAQSSEAKHGPEERKYMEEEQAVAVVPLGIPLLSGPGSIALSIVESNRATTAVQSGLLYFNMVLVGLVVWGTLKAAPLAGQALGKVGINVVTRLMGLVVVAIAVEFITDGLRTLLPGVAG